MNDITFTHATINGQVHDLIPRVSSYSNGRVALEFWFADPEMEEFATEEGPFLAPYAKVTVNMPDDHLNEGEFFVKDWAENEDLVRHLREAGWLTHTGREVLSGFVTVPVMRAAGPLADLIH